MRIDTAFPSQYLKASDLQGRPVTVIMDHVTMEEVGNKPKPVLYFQGKTKGLILNKTNTNSIAAAYGYETDTWTGHPIQLVEAMVDYQGRSVPAIRVRVQQRSAQIAQPIQQRPMTPPTSANGQPPPLIDDEVPF